MIITFKNGKKLEAEHSQKTFGLKLTEKQLVEKFYWLTKFVFPKEKTEEITGLILNVENLESVRDLISAMV